MSIVFFDRYNFTSINHKQITAYFSNNRKQEQNKLSLPLLELSKILLMGLSLGIILERGRFCFFCIFRDAIEDRNTTPILSILSAIAVGSVGYAILFGQFLPDTTTEYFPPNAHIGPVSWVLAVAGLVFGIGMTLSGACISGHLYRIGQGSLRAFPALLGSLIGFGLGFASCFCLGLI